MTKQEWVDEFVRIIQEQAGVDEDFAYEVAEINYEDCIYMTPSEAVEEELSYWGD